MEDTSLPQAKTTGESTSDTINKTSEASEPIVLLTRAKLATVFFTQLNEAYQITVLLPMVVFMVRDFGIHPRQLGIYTSILNASFCFCQFLCSYSWGLLSDRYGRRVSLMVGLVFSTIAIIFLGLSTTFGMAIAARCVSGFFNGNLGVIKAYLADITDQSNRAFAFSTLAIAYGFGSVFGSAVGGLLIVTHNVDNTGDSHQPTTGLVDVWIFGSKYPFLLPCLIGSLISANALIWVFMHVHDEKMPIMSYNDSKNYIEKNGKNKNKNKYQSIAIINKTNTTNEGTTNDQNTFDNYRSLDEMSKMAIFEATPGDGLHNMNLSLSLVNFSLKSPKNKPAESNSLLMSELHSKDKDGKLSAVHSMEDLYEYESIYSMVFDTTLFHALVVWTLIIICFMMYQEMNPVYMAQALNFNSQLIGFAMAFSGFALLIFTYYIQPYFLKRFRFRPMCIVCACALALVFLNMPMIFTISKALGLLHRRWFALSLSFLNSLCGVIFGSILFVCTMCWVNNSVPNAYVGRANGLGQTVAAFSRAVGPTITGFIWSGTVNHIQSNPVAVYYAYLPSFIGAIGIALWAYLFITDDSQEMFEVRLENRKQAQKIHDDTV